MKINWKVRFKNKAFWIAMIPAIIVLITQFAEMVGFVIDLTVLQKQLKEIIESIFLIMSILGIVVDPTTRGVTDSIQALTYDKPKKD